MPQAAAGGPQCRQAGGDLRTNAADCPGPPISTRRWPIRSTPIYFDAQTTDRRADAVRKAIAAGKHIYCEKPIADDLDDRARAVPTAPRSRA